jgi:putative exosortase-associated protein (TIGR04073 family)
MKKLLVLIASLTLASVAYGDIQDPPAAKYTKSRKLSRGLANIAYGTHEIPYRIAAANSDDGGNAALSDGVVRGVKYTAVRLGLGIYEVFTFPLPTTKGDYRPPYKLQDRFGRNGMSEFPPEMGASAATSYCRDNNYTP